MSKNTHKPASKTYTGCSRLCTSFENVTALEIIGLGLQTVVFHMRDWEEFLENFALAIRQRRLQIGLSQPQLAEKAGFQRTYVVDIERGARAITLKNAWRMAACLDLSLSELIDASEKNSLTESASSPRKVKSALNTKSKNNSKTSKSDQ